MSHFNLESTITNATRLDVPIERGPLMRWQKKAVEAGVRTLSLSDSNVNSAGLTPGLTPGLNVSGWNTPRSGNLAKTPLSALTRMKNQHGGSLDSLTPQLNQKPKLKKQPSTTKTPSGNSNKENSGNGQDRFIPCRSTTDYDIAHHSVVTNENECAEDEMSPLSRRNRQALADALGGQQPESKILSYKSRRPPTVKEGHMSNLMVLYSSSKANPGAKAATTRQIPKQAENIMDTPCLIDDYYLNIMDWSPDNQLTMAMGNSVYAWNANDGSVQYLLELEDASDYVSSVCWLKQGNVLAIGNSTGSVQLYDAAATKILRTMSGHAARVGSLSWNDFILTSGSRSSAIHHHDVRVRDHHVGTLTSHTQEVCGLAWSPDGRHLASGANDNMVCIWDAHIENQSEPLHKLTEHQSAVKALSWCPWQSNILASGGGTADRHIRFWNVRNGACLQSVDTNSQVCSILWSSSYRELVSGHGFSKNQLTLWKYPSMDRIADLVGHEARILSLAMSPDGSMVASSSADETVRLWKCFPIEKKEVTSNVKAKDTMQALTTGIR